MKQLLVGGTKFSVSVENNFYTDQVTLLINEGSYTLLPRERKQIDDGTIVWLNKFDEVGGNCKLFDSRLIKGET